MTKEQPREDQYNIVIKDDSIIYNTNKLYTNDVVKVPSYIVQELLKGNKKYISLRLKHKEIVKYTPEEFKRQIVTVEKKLYYGTFKNENIEYNLVQLKTK